MKKNNIKEELEQLGSDRAGGIEEMKFKLPASYFDGMQDNVMGKIMELEEKKSERGRKPGSKIFGLIRPWIATAAVVATGILIYTFLLKGGEDQNAGLEMADVSDLLYIFEDQSNWNELELIFEEGLLEESDLQAMFSEYEWEEWLDDAMEEEDLYKDILLYI